MNQPSEDKLMKTVVCLVKGGSYPLSPPFTHLHLLQWRLVDYRLHLDGARLKSCDSSNFHFERPGF